MSAFVAARLAELAARFALPAQAPEALRTLLDLVASDPVAPTRLRDPEVAVDAHVADALVALDLDAVRGARRLADIGSGAGFPGLVLAAALPQCQVTLVEATERKCAFLERAAGAMELANVTIVCRRVEEWPEGQGRQDVVTARAVGSLNVLVEYAAPLLTAGGSLVAWKGRRDPVEEADGGIAAEATGLEARGAVPVEPWFGSDHLHLHLYLKVRDTPDRFPRRPGMASKRPLRASTRG